MVLREEVEELADVVVELEVEVAAGNLHEGVEGGFTFALDQILNILQRQALHGRGVIRLEVLDEFSWRVQVVDQVVRIVGEDSTEAIASPLDAVLDLVGEVP